MDHVHCQRHRSVPPLGIPPCTLLSLSPNLVLRAIHTACVFGAAIVCVDSVIRLFPGKRNFRIEESNVFLACSLSLSFGVMVSSPCERTNKRASERTHPHLAARAVRWMIANQPPLVQLFSALYSMLPESREYLTGDGWSHQPAGLIMMGCFIGGFFGIQVVSRLLHQFMPSHVVDCDHSHEEQKDEERSCSHHRHESRSSRSRRRFSSRHSSRMQVARHSHAAPNGHHHVNESTPLLESPTALLTDYQVS